MIASLTAVAGAAGPADRAPHHHLDEPHPTWHPLWEWLGQPTDLPLFLAGTATALLGLTLAAAPRRDSLPTAAVG
jgi:hypothetical protein